MKPSAAPTSLPKVERCVLVLTDRVGATQEISFGRPLARLVEAGRTKLVMDNNRGWKHRSTREDLWEAVKPSLLVLSRYTESGAMWLIKRARQDGVPVVFHLDDDLLDVPVTIGQAKYERYQDPMRTKALLDGLNASDLVYASTPALGAVLAERGVTAPIYAGDVYCSIEPAAVAPLLPATAPVIGYMGTEGHAADLEVAMPAIIRLMEEFPDLRFEAFGTIQVGEALAGFADRVGRHPPIMDYQGFIDRLGELGWWLGIAPLEDTVFNRCKADTKWVEYSLGGIGVIASDLPVYHRACADGAGLLVGPDGWYEAMRRMLCDAAGRKAMVEAARRKLVERYSHEALERQVLDVFAQARRGVRRPRAA